MRRRHGQITQLQSDPSWAKLVMTNVWKDASCPHHAHMLNPAPCSSRASIKMSMDKQAKAEPNGSLAPKWHHKRKTQKTFPNNRGPPLFVHPFFLFFALSTPPFPRQFSSPEIPSCWDLRSTLSSRESATRSGWVLGTVLDRVAPQEKKANPFFLGRARKGERGPQQLQDCCKSSLCKSCPTKLVSLTSNDT